MSLNVSPLQIVAESISPLLAIADGWARISLGEVADIINGFPFPSKDFNANGAGEPVIRIRDVGKAEPSTWYQGNAIDAPRVTHGQIVVGMDGDFRVARWAGPTALLNQRVCSIRVRKPDVMDERFLLLVLPGYLNAINEHTSSITVKHLSSRTIADIPLPLPLLDEQRRIVEIIEEQFSRLDAAELAIKMLDRKIGQLEESTLRSLTSSVGDGNDSRLDDIGLIITGGTPSTKELSYWGNDVAFITPGDIVHGKAISGSRRFLSKRGASRARLVPAGSILVTCIGATIGKSGISERECAVNQQINAIVPDTKRALPEFVLAVISGSDFQRRIVEASSSTTLPILNKSRFEALRLFLPTLAVQKDIVQEIRREAEYSDRLQQSIGAAQRKSNMLRAAILAQAFSGRLSST